jgi:hypothetical protein
MTPSKSNLDGLPKQLTGRWEAKRERLEAALCRREDGFPGGRHDGRLPRWGDGPDEGRGADTRAPGGPEEGKHRYGPAGGMPALSFYEAERERLPSVRLTRMPEKATLKDTLSEEIALVLGHDLISPWSSSRRAQGRLELPRYCAPAGLGDHRFLAEIVEAACKTLATEWMKRSGGALAPYQGPSHLDVARLPKRASSVAGTCCPGPTSAPSYHRKRRPVPQKNSALRLQYQSYAHTAVYQRTAYSHVVVHGRLLMWASRDIIGLQLGGMV